MEFPWLTENPDGDPKPQVPFLPHIDRYSLETQAHFLEDQAKAGYTHFTLSWPDSRDGGGQSIDQYVATAKRVQAAGFYADHRLFAKSPYDSQNGRPENVYDVIDALIAAGAMDTFGVGWELDAWLSPDVIQTYIDKISDRVHNQRPDIDGYLHFQPHVPTWQRNSEKPRDFWMRQVGKIKGLHYQFEPSWDAGMMCARLNDVLVRLNPGGIWGTPGFDVIPWEVLAMSQWEGSVNELKGDLRGYEIVCTPGPIAAAGYGNGARRPDGTYL